VADTDVVEDEEDAITVIFDGPVWLDGGHLETEVEVLAGFVEVAPEGAVLTGAVVGQEVVVQVTGSAFFIDKEDERVVMDEDVV
jgi:hypothetical protein